MRGIVISTVVDKLTHSKGGGDPDVNDLVRRTRLPDRLLLNTNAVTAGDTLPSQPVRSAHGDSVADRAAVLAHPLRGV
jgi:hypothetical protein